MRVCRGGDGTAGVEGVGLGFFWVIKRLLRGLLGSLELPEVGVLGGLCEVGRRRLPDEEGLSGGSEDGLRHKMLGREEGRWCLAASTVAEHG